MLPPDRPVESKARTSFLKKRSKRLFPAIARSKDKMMRRDAISALVLLMTATLATVAVRAAAAPRDFADVGPAWQSAWNAKRGGDAAVLYAQDAVFAHASGKRVVGQPAIAALLKGALAVNDPTIALSPLVQARAGKGAWVSGTYRETIAHVSGAPTVNVHGSYLLVLRQDDSGGWLIEQMMWSDAP